MYFRKFVTLGATFLDEEKTLTNYKKKLRDKLINRSVNNFQARL